MPPPIADAAAAPKGRRGPSLNALAAVLARRPHRSVILPLAAATAGLMIAGVGLLHPAPHDLTAVPPGDVALVNQEPILTSDFMQEAETSLGVPFAEATPAQRAHVLHSMIDEELLVQRSLALDLPEQDTGVRTALADGVNNQVIAGVLGAPPADAALRAYFDVHRANYASKGAMTLTDLVLRVGGFENVDQSVDQALADAAQAVYELRSGASVDYVKQHFSLADSGKVSGEEIDFAARIHLGAKLYAAAQAMSDGQISDPIADSDGVHVLIMQHRTAPVFPEYDAVRNNVYVDYVNQRKAQAEQENLKFLRGNAQILITPGEHE